MVPKDVPDKTGGLLLCELSDLELEHFLRMVDAKSPIKGYSECIPLMISSESLRSFGETLEKEAPCEGCGNCCKTFDAVVVEKRELSDIADYLVLSEKDVLKNFKMKPIRDKGGSTAYRMPGDPCVFLESDICAIYPVRPSVCRHYPIMNTPKGLVLATPAWCKRSGKNAKTLIKYLTQGKRKTSGKGLRQKRKR